MGMSPESPGLVGQLQRAVRETRERPYRVDGPLLGFLAGGWLALAGAWKFADLDGGAAIAVAGSCLAIALSSVAIWDLVVKVFRIDEEYWILPPQNGPGPLRFWVAPLILVGIGMFLGHYLWR
jgi:hypothetical protein